jgi:hypothetical protein
VTCSHDYTYGTAVTLTATPTTGSRFAGWSGACTGIRACTVQMSQARSAVATFALVSERLTLAKTGGGLGTVRSIPVGISCGSTCTHLYGYGSTVTLTAIPGGGSFFKGWSGACTGTGTCTLTMDRAQSATATFEHKRPPACVVPRLKGKKLKVAKRALRKAHCRSGKISHRYSRRKKGRVISQRPHPRRHLRNEAKVNLIVSKGRRP